MWTSVATTLRPVGIFVESGIHLQRVVTNGMAERMLAQSNVDKYDKCTVFSVNSQCLYVKKGWR